MTGTVLGQGVETGRPRPFLSGAYILVGKIIKTCMRDRKKASVVGVKRASKEEG